MAWVVGETSVGPPSGVDPVGTMRLRISNNNNNNWILFACFHVGFISGACSPHEFLYGITVVIFLAILYISAEETCLRESLSNACGCHFLASPHHQCRRCRERKVKIPKTLILIFTYRFIRLSMMNQLNMKGLAIYVIFAMSGINLHSKCSCVPFPTTSP